MLILMWEASKTEGTGEGSEDGGSDQPCGRLQVQAHNQSEHVTATPHLNKNQQQLRCIAGFSFLGNAVCPMPLCLGHQAAQSHAHNLVSVPLLPAAVSVRGLYPLFVAMSTFSFDAWDDLLLGSNPSLPRLSPPSTISSTTVPGSVIPSIGGDLSASPASLLPSAFAANLVNQGGGVKRPEMVRAFARHFGRDATDCCLGVIGSDQNKFCIKRISPSVTLSRLNSMQVARLGEVQLALPDWKALFETLEAGNVPKWLDIGAKPSPVVVAQVQPGDLTFC